MKKKSSSEEGGSKRRKRAPRRKDLPRVPPPAHDIQVNCCRNPSCENFGAPPLKVVTLGRLSLTKPQARDGYQLRQAELQKDGSTKKLMKADRYGLEGWSYSYRLEIREKLTRAMGKERFQEAESLRSRLDAIARGCRSAADDDECRRIRGYDAVHLDLIRLRHADEDQTFAAFDRHLHQMFFWYFGIF